MGFIDDIKEPSEITIAEIVGLVAFCGMLALTNDFSTSLVSMIFCVGFLGIFAYIFKKDFLFRKKIKFL